MKKYIEPPPNSSRHKISVALLGVGGVGKVVLSQLQDLCTSWNNESAQEQHLNLVYLANSRKCLKSTDYENLPEDAYDLLNKSTNTSLKYNELQDYLKQAPGPSILLDCTASAEVAENYPRFLGSAISVVTPNKKAFSSSQELFDNIEAATKSQHNGSRAYIFYEASAGAGLPLLSTLTELSRTGDEIYTVEGVFSGTMSFLFNAFMPAKDTNIGLSAKSWSSIVRAAVAEGYTEPDPRADLGGLDVARKLTIIARTLGVRVENGPSDIPVKGLIPDGLKDCESAEDFLRRLPEYDDEMEKMRKAAEAEGKVVRYVGRANLKDGTFDVGPRSFDKLDPIATLKGSEKFVKISSRRYEKSSLIIQGGDANLGLTAMSVIGDLIKVLDRL